MISFAVDPRFVDDLRDDFAVNEDLTLYEFIGNDPVRAFYLGLHITEWFKDIDKKQRYLYSKQARHNKDDLEKYLDQIEFWSKRYSEKDEIDMVSLAEYIIKIMFWKEETEEIDKVKMAFFFGDTINTKQLEEQKNTSSSKDNKDFQEVYE